LLSPTVEPHLLEAKFTGFVERHKNHGKDYRRKYVLQPLREIHLYSNVRFEPEVNGNAKTVYFLFIIAIFILIIAWVNYINLSTARSIIRAKEVGVRIVLGSRRIQLIKQFIFESALLNILAVFFTLVIVTIFLPYFNQLTGKPLTLSQWSSVWFWLVLSISMGAILSAVYPAFILSSFSPLIALKGRFTHLSKGMNFRKCLVIFQFAISIILIIGTLTVFKQLSFMNNHDLGINIEQTLAVNIPGELAYSTNYINRFKMELIEYSSIKDITASSTIPGKEYSNASSGIRPLNSNPEDGKRCFFITVDYEYFDFFGVKLLAGRKFSKEFSTDKTAIILNEEAVKILGYESPVNALKQKILFGGLGEQIRETIGVIKNYHHESLKDSIQPIIFSLTEGDVNGRNNYFSLKIDSRNIDQTISLVKHEWDQVFSGKPFEYFFLDESFNNQYKSDRQFGRVFVLFAMLAIFISCLGLLGLASFTSEQRTKEICIRKVIGATVSGIVFLLSKEFIKWILLANMIAWPVAYIAMNKWLQNFAYRTSIGIGIFIISGLIALAIALFTFIYQSIRAANSNLVDALKYE
jgi:putative ABC transport system permease protein